MKRSARVFPFRLMLLPPVLIAACGEIPESQSSSTVRWEDLPELVADTVASIGGASAEGGSAFGFVVDGEVFPDLQRIALADRPSREIRIFDLEGDYLGALGGRGQGPGEFTVLGSIQALEDGGIGAWDMAERRFTRFGRDGDVLSVGRADLVDRAGWTPDFAGAFPDGRFVLRLERSTGASRSRTRGMNADTARLVVFLPDGQPLGESLSVERPARWWHDDPIMYGFQDLIFGRSLRALVAGDGLWVATTDASSLAGYSASGQRLSLRSLMTSPRPVSPDQVQAERERRKGLTTSVPIVDARGVDVSEELTESLRSLIDELDAHATAPTFDDMQAGSDGSLWLREYPLAGDDSVRWVSMAADGSLRGQLQLDRNVRLIGGAAEYVVLATVDALEAPVILVLTFANSG